MRRNGLTRREFLEITGKGAIGLAAGTALAACAPKTPVSTATPISPTEVPEEGAQTTAEGVLQLTYQGTIRFVSMNYDPSEDMTPTPENRYPIKNLGVVNAKWEEMHPGIKIELVKAGSDDYYTWLDTQLLGGTCPEIVFSQASATRGDKGLFVALDDYLNTTPNYYIEGNKAWNETFYHPAVDTDLSTVTEHQYYFVLDLVETTLFYNKDIFEKVGVEPPETWDKFVEVMKAIQDSGVCDPFMVASNPWEWWSQAIVGDMILRKPKWDQLKVINPETDDRITSEEGAWGAVVGIISYRDPQYQEAWRLLYDWTRYYPKGWVSMLQQTSGVYKAFVGQQIAIMWSGSWDVPNLLADPDINFKFGSFYVPTITEATSQYASGVKPGGVGGPGSIYSIAATANDKAGLLDAVIDYCKYLTAPENEELIVNEYPRFVPSVTTAKPHSSLESIMQVLSVGRPKVSCWPTAGSQGSQNTRRIIEQWFTDQIDEQTFFQKMQEELETGLVEDIKLNQESDSKWDLSKWSGYPVPEGVYPPDKNILGEAGF